MELRAARKGYYEFSMAGRTPRLSSSAFVGFRESRPRCPEYVPPLGTKASCSEMKLFHQSGKVFMMIGSDAFQLLDLFVDSNVKRGNRPRQTLGHCSLCEGHLHRGLRGIKSGRALTFRPCRPSREHYSSSITGLTARDVAVARHQVERQLLQHRRQSLPVSHEEVDT